MQPSDSMKTLPVVDLGGQSFYVGRYCDPKLGISTWQILHAPDSEPLGINSMLIYCISVRRKALFMTKYVNQVVQFSDCMTVAR